MSLCGQDLYITVQVFLFKKFEIKHLQNLSKLYFTNFPKLVQPPFLTKLLFSVRLRYSRTGK